MRTQFHPAVPWRPAPTRLEVQYPARWAASSPLEALAGVADDDHELAAMVLRRTAAILAEHGRPQLHRLVYVSRAAWGTEGQAARDAAILLIAQRRNLEAGVTGALLHSTEWFGQVLEGGLAGLEETFSRIDRDFRHSEIRVLSCECIETREFAGQAMAEGGLAPDAMLNAAAAIHARLGQLGGASQQALDRAAMEMIHVMHQHIDAG